MLALIIADDFTGANDTGIQFSLQGLKTRVFLGGDITFENDVDVFVIDTDSRSMNQDKAYEKVEKVIQASKGQRVPYLYKKIDSTMRGNVGIELDAVLEAGELDFVIVTPGCPDHNRVVRDGNIYVNDVLLEQTYFAKDVMTPINSSSVNSIIEESSKYETALLKVMDIRKGPEHIRTMVRTFTEAGIKIISCDSVEATDFIQLIEALDGYEQTFAWCGSAGLAEELAKKLVPKVNLEIKSNQHSATATLIAVGSVNEMSRLQLAHLLANTEAKGVEINPYPLLVSERERQIEINRVITESSKIMNGGKDIILSTAVDEVSRRQVEEQAKRSKMSKKEVSETISNSIGEVVKALLKEIDIKSAIFTGGDTAKKIANHINCYRFDLIDLVEKGLPMGKLTGDYELLTVTKAGGFGNEASLTHAYRKLKEGFV